jgi:hypothetical protein
MTGKEINCPAEKFSPENIPLDIDTQVISMRC